jgi:hypothetical protein
MVRPLQSSNFYDFKNIWLREYFIESIIISYTPESILKHWVKY